MTDTNKLLEMIEQSGLKKCYIAKMLDISTNSLAQKISNKREFKASEIDTLCKLLGITSLEKKEEIFFAGVVA